MDFQLDKCRVARTDNSHGSQECGTAATCSDNQSAGSLRPRFLCRVTQTAALARERRHRRFSSSSRAGVRSFRDSQKTVPDAACRKKPTPAACGTKERTSVTSPTRAGSVAHLEALGRVWAEVGAA
ncbi:hypothetical protein MRX96_009296 [Rhipicephalus microplus]